MSRQDRSVHRGPDRANLYDEITGKIIAELEAGQFPWVRPWGSSAAQAPLSLPQNASTGRAYSGINILILWGAVVQYGFSGQGWLTFRQALSLGGNVSKGEREREVGEQRSRNEARELDASLAAVDAVGEGLVAYENRDGGERLKAPEMAKTDPSFAELFARMKRAPNAAVAMGRRLAGSLALQRERAREQGLAEGRAEAQAEWTRELSAVRAAAQSIAALRVFTRDLIRRLPAWEQQEAKASLHSLVKDVARDVALNNMSAAARSRDGQER